MLSLSLSAVLFLGLCISSAVGYGQKILVLGGDGMLGSETVARLKLRGNDITVLHRGTWYWDSSKRIKPWVNFIQCDRDYFNECADKLGDVTREKGMWDAVFDFSGYKPKQIKVNSYLNKLYISSGKRCQPRKTRELESKQREALAFLRAAGAWLFTTSHKVGNAYLPTTHESGRLRRKEFWDCTRPHLSWLQRLKDPVETRKKGLEDKTTTLHVHYTFLYISLTFLHDYNEIALFYILWKI